MDYVPIFRYGTLYGGPPYLVHYVDPDVVISLTYDTVARSRNTKVTYHYPIEDFHVEPITNIAKALEAIIKHLSRGEKVYVHCIGGCGRTGTVISSYLILFKNYEPEQAIYEFYRMRGCTVESYEQRVFLEKVYRLYNRLKNPRKVLEILNNYVRLNDLIESVEMLEPEVTT